MECPKNIKERLVLAAAENAYHMLKVGDIDEAKRTLYNALQAGLHYARYFLEMDVGANLAVKNSWAIEEATKLGHRVIDVLEVPGEDWTCSLMCQASDDRRPYYLHFDDGYLRVNLSPDWFDHSNVGQFYTLKSYELVSRLPCLKNLV